MNDKKNMLHEKIEALKKYVISGKTNTINWRIKNLNRIERLLKENNSEILNALKLDLGKSKIEALSEILLVLEEIRLIKRKLKS